jgi:hypothetical protein
VAADEQGGMVEEDTTMDSLHLPTQSSNEFCFRFSITFLLPGLDSILTCFLSWIWLFLLQDAIENILSGKKVASVSIF